MTMRKENKWTVRGVDDATIAQIAEVSGTSGVTFGALINEAVDYWYHALPEASDDEE